MYFPFSAKGRVTEKEKKVNQRIKKKKLDK
jgi:hypothetical protein